MAVLRSMSRYAKGINMWVTIMRGISTMEWICYQADEKTMRRREGDEAAR